jgi:glucose/arabinose dehydrogenase
MPKLRHSLSADHSIHGSPQSNAAQPFRLFEFFAFFCGLNRFSIGLLLTSLSFWSTAQTGRCAEKPNELLEHQAALGDWTTDAPGVRRLIRVEDLPKPNATPSADRGAHIVPRPAGAMPKVPAGFTVELWAEKLENPRKISTAPNGDVFVAESRPGRVTLMRQGPDGKINNTSIFAERLRQPFGIAFYPPGPKPEFVYIANTDSVIRFPYQNGDLKPKGAEQVIAQLPGGGKLRGGGHWSREIVFSSDALKMLVSVGSHSDAGTDEPETNRADVLEFNPDGTGLQLYAWGVRNAVGLAIHPETGQLWGSVNERDLLGDDVPPDYITQIQRGGFYGFPWYYIGNHQDPRYAGRRPDLGDKVIVPDVLLQAHSASLCMTFYTARQFPERYRGRAFAAEHGSWNRASRTGYKVISVPFQHGKATGEYEDFMTGFVTESGDVWGRPVGVTVDSKGALIVTDDAGNCAWRISYRGGGDSRAAR